MAESLGIDVRGMTTEQFLNRLAESDFSELSFDSSTPLAESLVDMETIRKEVIAKVASFVRGLESEHIGKVSEMYMGLRAKFSASGAPIGLECEVYDRYEDLTHVLPDSFELMMENGKEHVSSLVSLAITSEDEDAVSEGIMAEPYYRLVARDYADQYTSNATQWCSHGKAKQNQSYWNGDFSWYCHNDCANYVSQAMYAGDVPTSSIWYKDSTAWVDCGAMKRYFYPSPGSGLWVASTFAACNEGGIILMFDANGQAAHVNMCVYNDTVTRKLSAHTTDRKQFVYDSSWLYETGGYNEYYIVKNADPPH